jgi:holo-[acyl-carrier protein] synthase
MNNPTLNAIWIMYPTNQDSQTLELRFQTPSALEDTIQSSRSRNTLLFNKMAKTFVGTDIVEIDEFQNAVLTWKDKFLNRLYTEAELAKYKDNIQSLAARFAGKEAILKALGADIKGSWREMEILATPNGAPYVQMRGKTLDKANSLGITSSSISLSHCKHYAIAVFISYAE